MRKIFIKIRRIVVPLVTLTLLSISLAGCAPSTANQLRDTIREGGSVSIEFSQEASMLPAEGRLAKEWVQLDQLQTHSTLRTEFDRLSGTIQVNDGSGVPGKGGPLFIDEKGYRTGNTSLEDGLRNRTFVERFWGADGALTAFSKISELSYKDVVGGGLEGRMASINAYYNLLTDVGGGGDDTLFKGSLGLSREQFMSLVFRSEHGVTELGRDAAYESATGGATAYSLFAQGVHGSGFLPIANRSLDGYTVGGAISRVEAIYLMVTRHFPEQLAASEGAGATGFSDTKDAGDLALRLGFKTREDGVIIEKDRWQAFTLAYMLRYPDKGIQRELYRAMQVARELGLIIPGDGNTSRWDEPITRTEALSLVVNTHLAKNELFGFLSTSEFGKMDLHVVERPAEPVQHVEPVEPVDGEDEVSEEDINLAPVDPNKVLPSGYTLGEVWLKVRDGYAWYIGMGFTPAEAAEAADEKAREHGTTFAELHRITEGQMAAVIAPVVAVPKPEPEPVVVVEQPAPRPQQPRPQQPAQPAQPAQVVSTLPYERDRDRDGVSDFLEERIVNAEDITLRQYTPEEWAELEELRRGGSILRPAGE